MKRLVAWLFVLLIIPVGLLAAVFCTPSQYEETFLGALRNKAELLAAEGERPRIIVAGGSGAAFGQDSGLLETLLPGYDVVNFGMYAGLGTAVMLDLAWPDLRAGDILIFSPEQSEQTLSLYFNAKSMWQAADGEFSLMTRLRGDDLSAMAGALADFAADKVECIRYGKPVPEGVYSRTAFNRWGDVAAERSANIMPGGYDPDMPVTFDPALLDADFAAYLRAYAARCDARGVTFLYRFCPMNAAAVPEGGLDCLEGFAAHLAEQTGCAILGEAADSVMDAGWFYDTNFHLNSAGAEVNTVNLARALCGYLGLDAPADMLLPEMPEMARIAAKAGDNADASCFLYEQDGSALRLTGLTAEGMGRERLVVPAAIDGTPVASFAPAVFAGNTMIREITVQGNIARMEDGSFEGCTALERIVLLHDSPADCPVSGGLLDGTNALVYVRQSSLSAYMTNYFWAVYAERLRGAGESAVNEASASAPEPAAPTIRYDGNGGLTRDGEEAIDLPMDDAHLRVNTAQGTRYFAREGYILTGWSTVPDGCGTVIGLGSRTDRAEGMTLYARWAEESTEADFVWRIVRGEAHITAYAGSSEAVVIPDALGGAKVTRICAGAFAGTQIDSIVLPPTMFCVERGAFTGSTVRAITLFDSLYYIYDASFEGCDHLTTLRINAATAPVYSGTYFDTFSDKYDWLLSIREEKKIVLFSGSSGRFGYDSGAIHAAFPAYQVANMGVYAYTNALPQYDLICDLMQRGDILLSAPEFDTTDDQFCETNRLDAHFFAMMESNYDALALLDLRDYTAVFDSLGKYLTSRSVMGGRSYAVSANGLDDDGNAYPFDTYNVYGDLILPRAGSEEDVLLQQGLADYTAEAFPAALIERLNAAYQPFLEAGVRVYFSYTPRNWSSLTEGSTKEARAALHARLKAHLCVPVISEIEDYLYPGTYFYLIDSHLSTEGVQLRTAQIIKDLQAQFDREKLSE